MMLCRQLNLAMRVAVVHGRAALVETLCEARADPCGRHEHGAFSIYVQP